MASYLKIQLYTKNSERKGRTKAAKQSLPYMNRRIGQSSLYCVSASVVPGYKWNRVCVFQQVRALARVPYW